MWCIMCGVRSDVVCDVVYVGSVVRCNISSVWEMCDDGAVQGSDVCGA